MRKIILWCWLLFGSLLPLIAQPGMADRLRQKLALIKEDTSKVILLCEASQRYFFSYADTGLQYAKEALDLAQKADYKYGISLGKLCLCFNLTTLGNYPRALDYGFEAMSEFETMRDTINLIKTITGLTICYREQGDYANALRYGEKSLKIGQQFKFKGLNQTVMLGGLSTVYEKNGQLDIAIKYAKKSYEMRNGGSSPLYVLGSAYGKKRIYDSALMYFRLGLQAVLKSNSSKDYLDIYNGIALVHEAMGNRDSAIYYSKKAMTEKSGQSYPLGLLEASSMLTSIYDSLHATDSSLKYLKVEVALKDSLFNRQKTIAIQNLEYKESQKQIALESSKREYQSRLRLWILLGGSAVLLAIALLLWRNIRHRQKAFALLQKQKWETERQKQKVEQTLIDLRDTQTQLIQSEKMASLGELTAGIAHEIQNPLNFVNNFSEVNTELIDEANQAIDADRKKEAKDLLLNLRENEEKIKFHGQRADAIVKSMLQHSRTSAGQKEPTDINALADEYLRLAYHGLRAKDKNFNARLETHFDENIAKINIIPQDIGRVLLNIFNNAFYAVNEKKKQQGENFEPIITVATAPISPPTGGAGGAGILINIKDNGPGIPQKVLDKIFQPFFTTKPTGQGTGLGLSLSYDIIKAHGGDLRVNTKEGEGAEFIVELPLV